MCYMTDPASSPAPVLPSVADVRPREEGGPIARTGFTYQDEVAVSFFIEMLGDPTLMAVHCETHDDLVVIRNSSSTLVAEFVQVKGEEPDQLWSAARLCQRDRGSGGPKVNTSIFEASLGRDRHAEISLFRLVTLRAVNNDLEVLTLPRGAIGREPTGIRMSNLRARIDSRCSGACSEKGNGSAFWLDNCLWDVRSSRRDLAKANLLALLELASRERRALLYDQAEVLLSELRARAKDAGEARWEPDRDQKIVTRMHLRLWWEKRLTEFASGATAIGGGKLTEKLQDVCATDEMIALAVEMRRDYGETVRTSKYMADGEGERLQARVKSEMMTLRTRFIAGQIDTDGLGFLNLCLERLDAINLERSDSEEDRGAFLKGCMFDITDRCLHRFARER
jgi:hypothetical protein